MKARILSLASIATLSIIVLAGCSISPYEGKYKHEDGWRKARIQEVGTLEKFRGTYGYTCSIADAKPGDTQVAIAGYQGRGRLRKQLMVLSDKAEIKADDLVYANIKQCDEPLIPRTAD